MPQLSTLLNIENVLLALVVVIVAALVGVFTYRRGTFEARERTATTFAEEARAYRERAERLEHEFHEARKSHRLIENRLLELEKERARSEIQHRFNRDEIELLNELIVMQWGEVAKHANGGKRRIEEKMAALVAFRETMRQKLMDFEDQQRIFRTFSKEPPECDD